MCVCVARVFSCFLYVALRGPLCIPIQSVRDARIFCSFVCIMSRRREWRERFLFSSADINEIMIDTILMSHTIVCKRNGGRND